MSEQFGKILSIKETHQNQIERIREYNRMLIHDALGAMPKSPRVTQVAFQMFASGFMDYPESIRMKDMSADEIPWEIRRNLVDNLLSGRAYVPWSTWFNEHISNDANPETYEKIIERNTDHFIISWLQRHNEDFPDPDWNTIDASYAAAVEGNDINLMNPLLIQIFNGLQVSAVEQFVESQMPKNPSIPLPHSSVN